MKRFLTRVFYHSCFKYRYVCPKGCRFVFSHSSGFCPFCGSKLVKTDNTKNLCKKCGWDIAYTDFCSKCGTKVEDSGSGGEREGARGGV